jgi:hypothetical protein
MESYIIRIYRRDAREQLLLDGVVETVPQGTQAAFHDMSTLWQILATPPSRARRREKISATGNPGANELESNNDPEGG